MRIHNIEHNVESNGILSQTQFSIKQSAKAFKILSSSLYTNKILAIIRELSCNAYDAHVDNGIKDFPFDLQLPTTLEPNFRIRDYGKGLSHDDLIHVYTTYFESTKTNSNDFIGALGLGSKSPFSYTNTFSVSSYHNGFKRSYSCYLDDQGLPNCVMLLEIPTHEKSGLEIEFPVHSDDNYSFSTNANKVFTYFEVLPQMVCNTKLNINTDNVEKHSNDWKIMSYNGGAKALQGNIAYPISLKSFPRFPKNLQYLLKMSLVITFPIGSLDVAASREDLSYDTETCQNIISKLTEISNILIKEIQDKFDKTTSKWDAHCLYNSLYSQRGYISTIVGNKEFLYDGKPLFRKEAHDLTPININYFKILGENKRGHYSETRRTITDSLVKISTSTGIVFNDVKSLFRKKALKYKSDNNFQRVYEFKIYSTWSNEEKQNFIDTIITYLGNPEYVMLSDIAVERSQKSEIIYNVQEYTRYGFEPEPYEKSDISELENVFYIPFAGRDIKSDNRFYRYQFTEIINLAKQNGYLPKDCTIVGLNKSCIRFFDLTKNHHIIDYIADKIIGDESMLNLYKSYCSIPDESHSYFQIHYDHILTYTILDDRLSKHLKQRKALRTISSSAGYENYRKLLNRVRISVNAFEYIETDYYSQLIQEYPLLHHLLKSNIEIDQLGHVIQYMNLLYTSKAN